jgi:Asp-tRNA(Asn)/Glu-tRNA(Gln) amidotransferase A subunit family amidase
MKKKPYNLTATEAIAEIKGGSLTPTELVRSCMLRIKQLEPKIHAWACYDEKIAMKHAEEIEKSIGDKTFNGKLYGVPIGVKDIYNTKDFPTEMGSPIWKGFTPNNDSRAVFYLKYEGGIVVGKTVTAEFAVHYPGSTVNPHDFERTPGTSSSGSAAAVASSMVPIAIGSQTAGSTIRPASYCGVYGFKPSFGMIPRTGVLKTVDVLDHVTAFARSIDDLQLSFEVMRVKGYDHPFIHNILENKSAQKGKAPWKIAFVKTHLWDGWSDYAKKEMEDYISRLQDNEDIIVEEVKIPVELKEAHKIHGIIYNKALSYYYKEEYANHKDKLSAIFRKMLEDGAKYTTDDYKAALEKQNKLTHRFDDFMKNYDCLITLSTAGEAKKGLFSADTVDSCLIWTLCGAPSVNIPIFKGPHGLPFGAQVVARKYHDYTLFNFLKYLKKNKLISDVSYEIE